MPKASDLGLRKVQNLPLQHGSTLRESQSVNQLQRETILDNPRPRLKPRNEFDHSFSFKGKETHFSSRTISVR